MAFSSAVAIVPIAMVEKAAVSIATLITPDATNGNRFFGNRNTLLRVKNASGGTITVTVHTTRLVEGQAVADDTFTVAATTGDVIYSGFSDIFKQNQAGEVWVTFSAVSSVTAQVIQL